MDGLQMILTLHRCEQIAHDVFADALPGTEITPRQATLLVSLSEMAPCSQTDLVAATGIDRSTLADLCRRMQRKGWLTRRRMREDARTYAVALTDSGRMVLRKVEAASDKIGGEIAKRVAGVGRLRLMSASVVPVAAE